MSTELDDLLAKAAETSEVGKVLAEHYREHGKLDGESLVEAAAQSDHPLHSRFTWDDTEAARRYRIEQANQIIRSVRVRVVTPGDGKHPPREVKVRAFVSTRNMDAHDETRYMPMRDVITDDSRRAVLEARMHEDFRAFRRRWSQFKDFEDMVLGYLTEED